MNTNTTPPVTVTTTTPPPATDATSPVSVTVTVTLAPPVIAAVSSPPPPLEAKNPAAVAVVGPTAPPSGEPTPEPTSPKATAPVPEPASQPDHPEASSPEVTPPEAVPAATVDPSKKAPAVVAGLAPDAPPTDESIPAPANPKAMAPAPEPAPQPAQPATTAPAPKKPAVPSLFEKVKKWLIPILVITILVVVALVVWFMLRPSGPGKGFVSGNGRLEATEIDVAAKLAGRVQDILVGEGDFVTAGQILAHMQVQTLEAQRDEAAARLQQSITAVASAEAQVVMRQSDKQAVLALVKQRESESDAARRRLLRSETLTREGAASAQELDDDRARLSSTQAAVAAAKAQVDAAQAAIVAARTQVVSARSAITAVEATVTRIKADIDDSALTAPRDGRVQYRIAQPGEVLAAGGKVLNLVDLADVYMTFFVPEAVAGQLALGSEVHIVLDAASQYVIPTTVSFVASTAQFTPKTVETASERQKLMFRVKAQIDRELLQKHLKLVKTGLPGVAWIKLDAKAQWPAELATKVPQ
jgi:HlyD family secretion protein